MKNLTKIFMAVVAGIFAFACTTDTTEDLGVKIEGQGGTYEVSISLEESRTQLGEKVDGLYPLYWSEGDAIAINGVVSNPLTAGGATSALFSFNQEVFRPYCVVYPATEGAGEGTVYPVNFLAEQPYTVGTFAPQAAPMYGYAAEEGVVSMQHLAGALRLAIKGNGEKVTNIKVKAENGKIAGPFTVDCANGTLTAGAEAISTVTVTCGEGLTLGAEATPVYLAVPAGNYGTFVITVNTEAHGKMTLKFNSDAKPIAAGIVREFKEFAFMANTSDSEGTFIIDSEEALIEFARIAATFYPYTKAVVTADLDMSKISEEDLANFPIEGFGTFEFDGGSAEGCTISNLTTPLFGTTSAHFKNVTLSNINITETSRLHSGALACVLEGGALANCEIASGTFTYNNTGKHASENDEDPTYLNAGCMVGFAKHVSINNCTNRAKMVVTQAFNERGDKKIRIPFGGIVGMLDNESHLTCDNLKNYGDMEFNIPNGLEPGDYFMGGICGYVQKANFTNLYAEGDITYATSSERIHSPIAGGLIGGSKYITINTAENHANITLNCVAGYPYFGGAIGQIGNSSAGETVVGVKNYGTITIGANEAGTKYHVTATAYIGGIVAVLGKGSKNLGLKDCENHGTIAWDGATDVDASGTLRLGGISGTSSIVSYDNCDNYGTISVSGIKPKAMYVAGVVPFQQNYAATIVGCDNNAPISVKPTYKTSGKACVVGGVFGHSESVAATIKNCTNGKDADITLATSTSAILCMGGVVGYTTGPVENVTNRGAIEVVSGSISYGVCLGGVVGRLYDKELTGGYNYGTVTYAGESRQEPTKDEATGKYSGGTPCSIGGVIGLSEEASTISKLYNYEGATITIAGTLWPSLYSRANSFGGVVGCIGNGSQSNVYNYADVIFTATVIKKDWSSSASGYLAGSIGYLPGSLTNVENHGDITVGNESKNVDMYYGAKMNIAGVYARGANSKAAKYNNVHNFGNIAIHNRISGVMRVAGVNANNTRSTYTNVSNSGDITIGARAMSSTGAEMCVGGVFASFESSPSDGVNYINADGVTNSGDITVSANNFKDNVRIGGIVGMVTKATDICKNFTNSGNITFNGTIASGKNVIAGGIFGLVKGLVTPVNIVNSGEVNISGAKAAANTCKIYAAGLIGYSNIDHTISNEGGKTSMNTGNVIVTKGETIPAANVWAAGALAYTTTAGVDGVTQFGNVTAANCGNVGMLIGVAHTDTIKATNSKVGGTITKLLKYSDTDAGGELIEIEEDITWNISAENIHQLIYATEVDASIATGNNVTVLTSAPSTEQPAPEPEPTPEA